jgi:hypothetical protein
MVKPFVAMDLLEGGWVQLLDPLPGYESHTVYLRADLVDGEPRITGVRLEPRQGVRRRDAVLTTSRLGRLPMSKLAAAVYHFAHLFTHPRPGRVDDVIAAIEEAAAAMQPRSRGRRAKTTAEAVAAIYRAARLEGEAPRAAVCRALNISHRTAGRYISEARRRGLLPPYQEEEA